MIGDALLIGELATLTGTTTATLRYYERRGLLPAPERTASGYRRYADDAPGRVSFIRSAQAAGLTLDQITHVLAIHDAGEPTCDHVAWFVERRLADLDDRIAELRAVRSELEALLTRLGDLDPSLCMDSICVAIVASSPPRATHA